MPNLIINEKSEIIIPKIRQKNELPLKNLVRLIFKDYTDFSKCKTKQALFKRISIIMELSRIQICQDLSIEHIKMLVGIQLVIQNMIELKKIKPEESKKVFIRLLNTSLDIGRSYRSRTESLQDWVSNPLNKGYFYKTWALWCIISSIISFLKFSWISNLFCQRNSPGFLYQ